MLGHSASWLVSRLPSMHRCLSLTCYSPKWCDVLYPVSTSLWCTIKVHKNILLLTPSREQNIQIRNSWPQYSVAEAHVTVKYAISSVYPTFSGMVISWFWTKVMKRTYKLGIIFWQIVILKALSRKLISCD